MNINCIVQHRIDTHDKKIKELYDLIMEEEYDQALLYSNVDSDHWLHLRKKIVYEYFQTLPKSMGNLKKHQKQKNNEWALEYNKLLLEYDTYSNSTVTQ
jgi:regulator of sigma D